APGTRVRSDGVRSTPPDIQDWPVPPAAVQTARRDTPGTLRSTSRLECESRSPLVSNRSDSVPGWERDTPRRRKASIYGAALPARARLTPAGRRWELIPAPH